MVQRGFGILSTVLLVACGGDDESPKDAASGTTGTVASTTTGAGGSGGASTSSASTGGGGALPTVPEFGAPTGLSDPANNAFSPAIAVRDGQCLVAWHEFVAGDARIRYARIVGGVAAPSVDLVDPFIAAKRPSLATTPTGYVLAYVANDGATDLVRAVEIDEAGAVVSGPDTISPVGVFAAMPKVTAAGAQQAFSWTEGAQHGFAMRGTETFAATPVGTTLDSQTILNYPRIALDASGNLFLAYRDGGTDGIDWDVLLLVRPPGGSFGPTVNVSNTAQSLSDDIALAVEADGTLDLAWVDQDAIDPNAFEVDYATRSPAGDVSDPMRYGNQGLWTWTPSVVPGLEAVWYVGVSSGDMYFGAPGLPPTPILPGEKAGALVMVLGPAGEHHLAWQDGGIPNAIHYVIAPAP